MAERVGDAVAEGGAEFRRLGPAPGRQQTLLAPQLPPDRGEGVGEGRARLAVPSVRGHGRAGVAVEARGEQGYEGEQREQAGRGARDRPVGPLALRLDAEVVAHLPEGDLHPPAADEPADDPQRVARRIGAEQDLGVEAAPRVAQQHPADRHDRRAGVAPHGGAGADLDHALSLAVPAGHGDLRPARARVGQDGREVRQAGPPRPRGAPPPGPAAPPPPPQGPRRGGAGSYRAASSRRRVTQIRPRRTSAARRSRAAKLLSPTSTTSRPGSQRRAWRATCRAQSVSFLWRLPRWRQYRSEGARAVRNGRAQTRPAQGIGARSIRLSQRRPPALTKWPLEERTGSR